MISRISLQKRSYILQNLPCRNTHTVVLIRHGESIWNVENNRRFTGWCDIPLTSHGEADARDAGSLMGQRGLKFDIAFTSNLERAWRTCAIALSEAGQSHVETIQSWKLNERHYGALQGHYKNCQTLTNSFGEEKLIDWRRSYHTTPPSLYDPSIYGKIDLESFRQNYEHMNHKYINIPALKQAVPPRSEYEKILGLNDDLSQGYLSKYNFDSLYPGAESLKDCEERAFGYWNEVIAPRVKAGYRVLIVAHANTIRALVKAVDNISDDMIAHLKIPNGVPLVYTFNEDLEPVMDLTDDIGLQAKYLVSARNHKKMLQYERCTLKKLRNLFEYLDKDNDGRITQQCLQTGLNQLQNYGDGEVDPDMSVSCEYNIEEILRCIPKADDKGGITLDAFLESEATLLPKLSTLRLLT